MIAAGQLLTVGNELANDGMHSIKRIATEAWITGMPALAFNEDALHHRAFVHAQWTHASGLADHCVAGFWFAGIDQGAGAGHASFFVASGQNNQRCG